MEVSSQFDSFKKSSRRFEWAMWLNSELIVRRPEIVGLENLKKISKGVNPIIAGSHLRSDASLQIIARELSEKFNIGIAVQSGNRKDPLINALFTVIGQSNFYDIDSLTERKKVDGKSTRIDKYVLNLDNYDVMKDAMDKGKTIIISAHYSPIYTGILPNKPGFAAIYLAHLSGQRVIVPVVLDMQTDYEETGRVDKKLNIVKNLLMNNRPKSKMTICEPITFDPIDPLDFELMKKWIKARVNKKPSGLNSKEQEKAENVYRRMRQVDGSKVMYALAKALPMEKRGRWNRK